MLGTDDFAMLKKKALVAVLCAVLLGSVLSGDVPPAPAGEAPPLEGAFADNFTFLTPSVPAPREAFHDLSGNPVRLADFKGRVVLLNFWATWCAPCIREMPSLDRLQAGLGSKGLSVVAVSIDGQGAKAIVPFAERLKLEHIGLYHDFQGALFKAFAVDGIPTTFLIDAGGMIVGGYPGSAEWNSPEAVALVRHYLRSAKPKAGAVKTGG